MEGNVTKSISFIFPSCDQMYLMDEVDHERSGPRNLTVRIDSIERETSTVSTQRVFRERERESYLYPHFLVSRCLENLLQVGR